MPLLQLLVVGYWLLVIPGPAWGQGVASSVAVSVLAEVADLPSGTVLCAYSDGNKPCASEYDPQILGVVSREPAAWLQNTAQESSLPLINSGKVRVRVKADAGIKKGDFVTTSATAGVGQKATHSGYVVGTAQADQEGETILVAVDIRPAIVAEGIRGNLLETLRQGLVSVYLTPITALRYFLAIVVTAVAFTLGFVYFGRVAKTGVEAVGRNPIAARPIQLSVVVNVAITIAIAIAGLALAYLILIL